MKVFVNYPETEEGKKILFNNLATFKAELLLRSIDNLDVTDTTKDKILEKVLEILENSSENSVI